MSTADDEHPLARIGFIGLGSQGGPMARRILDAGYPTALWARRPETLEPFAETAATVVASPAEVGAHADILAICVVDDAGVDEVLRGPHGALSQMAARSIVIVHSTVHPDTCVRLQEDHPHLHVIDAPVSGGGHVAAVGELLVMVGGPIDVVERCRPVLETFGDPVPHLGPLGSGQEAKVLNNTVFAAQLALASEVFALAADRGLDLDALATVLSRGSGRSYAAEVVAGGGFDLEGLAPLAGALLAKDVGILVGRTDRADTVLVRTADVALSEMHVSRDEAERSSAL